MLRKIPATMASQHPDHASKPFWCDDPFIPAQLETKETMIAFSELGIDEYKWDWEGKLVDESVTERLLGQHFDYFKENQLGVDKFLTFRLPNPYEETEFRVGRAFMGILSAAALAHKVDLHTPPLFEVILPMAESAKSMIDVQEAFREIASLKHWMFNMQKSQLQHIQMIPLFEQVDVIANSDQIILEYLKMHEEHFGFLPNYLRPYVARSDPSLNSGHPATVLAITIAFSRYKRAEKKTGIPMHPIIGCAALPFRGGLTPLNVDDFVNEYAGVKTVLIQSAFRYDYTKEEAIQGVARLNELLPQTEAREFSLEEEQVALKLMSIFQKCYRPTIENVAPLINGVAKFFPSRRERVQHVGLFGYSRGVGKVKLPRAIKLTGSLYSVGICPEIFGVGRALKEIMRLGKTDDLRKFYLNIEKDYLRVGAYLNKKNLQKLATQDDFWKDIIEDVEGIETYLGKELKPLTEDQKKHQELTTLTLEKYQRGEDISDLIVKSGVLRKSLG